MNRDKEKFIAEKLQEMANLMPDYDQRKLIIKQIAAAFIVDLDGEDEPKKEAEPVAQQPEQEPEKAKKKTTTKKKAEPVAPQPEPEPEAPQVTLAEVRAVLAAKSEEGKGEEVKALIAEFKASKLSEVDPQFYANLKARGEEL